MPIQSKTCKLSQYKQLAASPDTSPEQLHELAAISSKPICERIAANPNTPIDVLLKLGAKYPKQLLENPVLPLLLLENPNFLQEIPLKTLISILKQEQAPDYILNTASKHDDENVLMIVASNINTCKTVLENLARCRYPKVQQIAKLHVNLVGESQETWEEIIKKADIYFNNEKVYEVNQEDLAIAQLIPDYLFPALHNNIISTIAQHPNTPVHTLKALCGNSFHYIVHESVALNPKTPATLLESLAGYHNKTCYEVLYDYDAKHYKENVFAAIASNPNTPISLLEELSKRPSLLTQKAIAANPITPTEILDLLANHTYEDVRAKVAQNPNTSINSLQKLCVDLDNWVRYNAAENINMPANLLKILATDKEIRIRMRVASHPNIPRRALELFAQDEDGCIRCDVAKNPNTPTNILSVLATDKVHSVRNYAALNSNISTSMLKALAQDEYPLVRRAVASNPNTPLYILKELAKDKQPCVHLGLATNPNIPQYSIDKRLTEIFSQELAENLATPASILTALAKHSDRRVRMSVAMNKSAPEKALEILAKDKKHEVRHAAARNPNMCQDKFAKVTLERIAFSSAPCFSRFIVFLHPQVPQQALIKNYRSPLWLERYAIAQNPNTPKHILNELTSDANRIVRAAASSAIKHIV